MLTGATTVTATSVRLIASTMKPSSSNRWRNVRGTAATGRAAGAGTGCSPTPKVVCISPGLLRAHDALTAAEAEARQPGRPGREHLSSLLGDRAREDDREDREAETDLPEAAVCVACGREPEDHRREPESRQPRPVERDRDEQEREVVEPDDGRRPKRAHDRDRERSAVSIRAACRQDDPQHDGGNDCGGQDRGRGPGQTERSEERRGGEECRSRWSPDH